ncbi:MAG: DUF2855 family protein [Solirubrobacterales bacterium]
MDFELRRDDLHSSRFVHGEPPAPSDGEALLRIESFGLTSNNVTYAVFGEAMSYWDFFPASEPERGRLNVWGYAHVADSRHPELEEGVRVYGYLPCSSHLLVVPDRVDGKGFFDAAPHRAALPSAYQGYRDVRGDPVYDADREDEQILFWPLFYTSFLVDDFFADAEFFGAGTVILSSASSKTALIAAYLLAQREEVELIGLTSECNADFVRDLKIYDEVLTYDEVGSLPTEGTVYADFSGNADLRAAVHEQCGEGLAHSATIGMTHHDEMTPSDSELSGPKPSFFFAPDRIRVRGEDWGAAELEKRVAAAWHPFAEWSGEWLEVRHGNGPEDLEKTYHEVLDGEIGPEVGPVLSIDGEG